MSSDLVELSGKSFSCYQAGSNYGAAVALSDAAIHFEQVQRYQYKQLELLRDSLLSSIPADHALHTTILDLPNLATPLSTASHAFHAKASGHRKTAADYVRNVERSNQLEKLQVHSRLPWLLVVILLCALCALYASKF